MRSALKIVIIATLRFAELITTLFLTSGIFKFYGVGAKIIFETLSF
ncbi:hypothetical protein ADU37_CDS08650 [Thermococcus sp. 2319x1]|nr:hypothetical protein ADU37_CDS08650 [Thermococcus sp. 2319x1]